MMADSAADVRRVLALSVGKGKAPAGVGEALVGLLDDPDREVRVIAIHAIGALGADAPRGVPDLDQVIARLRAYADAGADCLYAPGIKMRDDIAAVVAAVAPKPVNLLVGSTSDLTLRDIAALGVRRVSVGGALARSAWGGFMRAAQALAQQGSFDGLAGAASGAELNALMRD